MDKHKEYKLKLQKSVYMKKGLTGLENLGNTCYVNSIIQCLSNTLKITDYIISNEYKKDDPREKNKTKENHKITLSYIFTLKKMWETNVVIRPSSLIRNLRIIDKVNFNQQDAHEFLLFLLNNLNENLAYPITFKIKENIQVSDIQKKIVEKWYEWNKLEYSVINENFNIMYIISIKCNNCNNEELIYEQSYDISLSVAKSNRLEDLLEEYFKEEIVKDKLCEKCNKSGCTKQTFLWNLPKYVIIHLQKFDNYGNKIEKSIDYNNASNINYLKYFSKHRNTKNNYFYELYAINCHQGNSDNGHYYSICKNLNNKLYIYDDADVYETTSFNDSNSYILFFERKFISKK